MLLAIDVGNTHTVFGLWNGSEWVATWRHETSGTVTEDQLATWLKGLFEIIELPFRIDGAICASVSPTFNETLDRLCDRYFSISLRFLRDGRKVGMKVTYEPPSAVGADRIANALGALDMFQPPIIVVDFGTATTLDAIGSDGTYLGGAILPGVLVSSEALYKRAAKLPHVENIPLVAPETAIGTNTVHALQSGIVLGYAGAIEALATKMSQELGGSVKIVSTGGLGSMFIGVCPSIERHEPNLTLDGLRIAYDRLNP